ncbi:glycosyltransferase family 2 protein [Schauerella aestuarii]|uniref:glycosyltransferase family 2 protein n=1 Tax=Schauerella aestuarii TaxID=2511204 RepID=UPI00136CB0C3|nr:glycosyltransferase family 2 protein [Achromobacter aestuarii]MYZ43675.1 glycosyltransferase family 2 protein [Achromobacter aestuarii]
MIIDPKIAVVIPSYKVTAHIIGVLDNFGPEVQRIYVVDDCCPDKSGDYVETHCHDPRVRVIRHVQNAGVGGAVLTGYQAAIEEGMDIVVKVDGDGQMDPKLLPRFVMPIVEGWSDYTKGNRFYDLAEINQMPKIRLFGNAGLSFMTKISSGYWGIFDPTNGYTAIDTRVAAKLPFDKISSRYFFETDMLFRLNTLRAVVTDVPMHAHYGDEESNLKIKKIFLEFLGKHTRNAFKRIFYSYFLRDMNAASLELIFGVFFFLFGVLFGAVHWINSSTHDISTPIGTVMLAALPMIAGIQLLLAFVNYDVANAPSRAISKLLPRKNASESAVDSPTRPSS